MTLQQLHVFLAVADSGSLRQAARRQPESEKDGSAADEVGKRAES